jgi:RNA polymerase sigma factor (sigma-70 family)
VTSSLMDAYMSDVRKLPRLNDEQRAELRQFAIDGDKAAGQRLWQEAMRVVLYAATHLTRGNRLVPDLDLIQEGNLAAGKAAATWDPSRAKFSTWIYRAARGGMLDYWNKERAGGTGGKDAPTPIVIALDAGAGVIDDYAESDEPGTELPDESTVHDTLDLESAYDSPESHAQRAEVKKILARLPDNMQRAVSLYYGLDGANSMTFQRIAEVEGTSTAGIHRLITHAHKLMLRNVSF